MTALFMEPSAPLSNTTGAALDQINRKLDLLTQSLDGLTTQVQWLTERSLDQQRRQREWDELREDLMPVLHEAYDVTVEEMQALEPYVRLDDLVLLVKRLARNTRTINQLLDWLESIMDLTHDANRMGREMMTAATETLQSLEQKGYVGFVRQSQYVLDQIVTSFSEDDVRQLGDNIVLILNTVKALTQPEMMTLLSNLTQGFHGAEATVKPQDAGLLALARQARDPDVRRGLAITLATLKRVSAQSR
jgi:uncharacterized protein YjgD (DUF1641 family)